MAAYRESRRGCGYCLLTTALKILIFLIVVVGVAVLILWLAFRSHELKFHVTRASLTEFGFSSRNQLHYNLALNFTIRNPHRILGIYYDTIEATAIYKDQRLETRWLTPFYQGHKTTSELSLKFDGQKLVLLDDEELEEFDPDEHEHSRAAVFDIDVNFNLQLRMNFGVVRIRKVRPKIMCGLKVPLTHKDEEKSDIGFQKTGCDVDF